MLFQWDIEDWSRQQLKARLKLLTAGKTAHQKRLSIPISSLVTKLGGKPNKNREIKISAALKSEFGVSLEEAVDALNKYQ